MTDAALRRRRSGGRAGNTRRTSPDVIRQMPWRLPANPDRPTEPLTEAGVQAIHEGAMQILEEIGIEFLNDESLGIFKKAGCKVVGTNVRMGRDFVMEMMGSAPSTCALTQRTPDRPLTGGKKHLLSGNVSFSAIIADQQARRQSEATTASEWLCIDCDETNEPSFDIWWNCQAIRDRGP